MVILKRSEKLEDIISILLLKTKFVNKTINLEGLIDRDYFTFN